MYIQFVEEQEREDQIKGKGGNASKTSWFGKLGYNTTLTLPATMGSALLDKIKNIMTMVPSPKNYRTLLLEDGGKSLKQDLVKSDTAPDLACNRPDCITCASGHLGKCRKSGCGYTMVCERTPCNHSNQTTLPN